MLVCAWALASCGDRAAPEETGCIGNDCSGAEALALVGEKYGLENQAVERSSVLTFDYLKKKYHLVLYRFGLPNDCPSGCSYSMLCTIVVDGQDYPFYFSFLHSDEVLFDTVPYCGPEAQSTWMPSSSSCDMPGFDLPLTEDPEFRDWVFNPAYGSAEPRWCRSALRSALN